MKTSPDNDRIVLLASSSAVLGGQHIPLVRYNKIQGGEAGFHVRLVGSKPGCCRLGTWTFSCLTSCYNCKFWVGVPRPCLFSPFFFHFMKPSY